MNNNILEINHLRKYYYTPQKELLALKDITFELAKGDFIGLIGPSGCGKSTILSIISGIDKDYEGVINSSNNKFGYMFQDDALFDWRTVLDNALIGLEIEKNINRNSKQYVIDLLKKYGLKDFINDYPSRLSGGMRKRVALIRTLAIKPDIVLLDEPFSALDYQTRIKVSNDVFNILKKEGKSAIIVTHDIEEAITFSNKVIILSKRPSVVKRIIDTSNITNKNSQDFFKYYDMIWKEIDKNE